jgi:hypothetical protein
MLREYYVELREEDEYGTLYEYQDGYIWAESTYEAGRIATRRWWHERPDRIPCPRVMTAEDADRGC